MPSQPSLFDTAPAFDRDALALKLRSLAARNIFIGTSSWRYEGWLGQVYTAERYMTRGRFSKAKFHDECIQEYAETFPVVCGDFSFYSIPEPKFWNRLFTGSPTYLKWSLKAPDDFTTKQFSSQARYGPRRGLKNPAFLDADLFAAGFLEPLAPFSNRIGVIIIEFGTFSKTSYSEPGLFFDDLGTFLQRLPRDFRYSVEIRNEDYLGAGYFDVLKANNVAHTFSSWSRMPSLRRQLLMDEAITANHTAARALLRHLLRRSDLRRV